jgi:hypothetical protein
VPTFALFRTTGRKEVTVKARLFRMVCSVSVLSALTVVLGAPKKWG